MRLAFGDFVLDRASRQLLRGGEDRHLEPKALELLDLLLTRRPEAVSKSDIRDRLWPGTFVSDSSLTRLVAQIRRALADDRRHPRFVRTVHGFGYAFSGVASLDTKARTGQGRGSPRVVHERRIMPLAPGENILGRDEDVEVRINAPGVSRQHARIVVLEDLVTLEDLGSKNGTYLREHRLQSRAVLRDGDTFRLGRSLLIFRSSSGPHSTLTESPGPHRPA
jgi:DNA-binding winged helix-turn-helix (wHTH) protein